jgi:hypothetical protein
MRKKQLIFLLIVLTLTFSCKPGKKEKNETKTNELAGTWRLVEYSDFDTITKKWMHPYGEHPRGYFTYTKNGIVNLSVSAENSLSISEDSAYTHPMTLGALLDNAASYFGTYTIDYKNSTVTHHPKGGSIPWYIGTDQHRQFILNGDSLFIGDPTFKIGKRVLVREE